MAADILTLIGYAGGVANEMEAIGKNDSGTDVSLLGSLANHLSEMSVAVSADSDLVEFRNAIREAADDAELMPGAYAERFEEMFSASVAWQKSGYREDEAGVLVERLAAMSSLCERMCDRLGEMLSTVRGDMGSAPADLDIDATAALIERCAVAVEDCKGGVDGFLAAVSESVG